MLKNGKRGRIGDTIMCHHEDYKVDWRLCPRCKKREREISTHDGGMEMYCDVCNDALARSCREANEFAHFHPED
jgi:hypothetical protein